MLFRRRGARPGPDREGPGGSRLRPPGHHSPVGLPAPPLEGVDPAGSPVLLDGTPGRRVVLFLTSTCVTCTGLWPELAAAAPDVPAGRMVVVTPGPSTESRRRVAALAPGGQPVLMSGDTWLGWSPGPAPWAAVVDDGVVTWEGPAPADRDAVLGLLEGRTGY